MTFRYTSTDGAATELTMPTWFPRIRVATFDDTEISLTDRIIGITITGNTLPEALP